MTGSLEVAGEEEEEVEGRILDGLDPARYGSFVDAFGAVGFP